MTEQPGIRRQKRGWIDGMGEALRVVTGVMSSSDREKINDKLSLYETNQMDILQINYENTKIIDNTLKYVNETIEIINENNLRMYEEINKYAHNYAHGQRVDEVIFSAIIRFDYLIRELKEKLFSILQAIADAHNNILTSNIYPLKNILLEMSKIKLVNGQKWIVDLAKPEISILRALSKVMCVTKNNIIYFIIRIPIVVNELQMIQLIDIPRIEDENLYYINTNTKYIVTDMMHEKYAEITEVDLVKYCSQFAGIYYCTNINIFNIDHSSCINKLLERSDVGKMCETRMTKLNNNAMLINMIDNNRVILIAPKKKYIKIKEHNELQNIEIENTIMITAEKETVHIIAEDHEILIHNSEIKNVTIVMKFKLNIPKLSAEELLIEKEEVILPEINDVRKVDKKALNEQSKNINDVKLHIKDIMNQKLAIKTAEKVDIMIWIWIAISIILITIMTIYVIYVFRTKLFCKMKSK
jgi:hypothetical protein